MKRTPHEKGMIVKAISGVYHVLPEHASPHETLPCRARGVFRKRNITPLVGDEVLFAREKTGEGTVVEVLPRKNELIRPPVANVDTVLFIFSVYQPRFNRLLLDKFLVHAEKVGLESIICFSKADLLAFAEEDFSALMDTYGRIGYKTVLVSIYDESSLVPLKALLARRRSVLAGQSGVGKSSLLNALLPDARLATGAVSEKIGRGRHTTRHVEFLPCGDGGWVADTPGFSQLDFHGIEAGELGFHFREFADYSVHCRFRGCLHVDEPDCMVRQAAEEGRISGQRYENYKYFLKEIKSRKRRY